MFNNFLSIFALASLVSAPFVAWHLHAIKADNKAGERRRLEARALTPPKLLQMVKERMSGKRIGTPGQVHKMVELGDVVVELPAGVNVSAPGDVGVWRFWQSSDTTQGNSERNPTFSKEFDLGVAVLITHSSNSGSEFEMVVFTPAPNSWLDRAGFAEGLRRDLNDQSVKKGNVFIRGNLTCVRVGYDPQSGDEIAVLVGDSEANPAFQTQEASFVVGIQLKETWQNSPSD